MTTDINNDSIGYKEKLEKIIKNEDDLDYIIEKIMEINMADKSYTYDENEWGSCQYSGSFWVFKTLGILNIHFKNPLEVLNIKIIGDENDENYCEDKEIIKWRIKLDLLKDNTEMILSDFQNDLEDAKGQQKFLTQILIEDDFDKLFNFYRKSAFHLSIACENVAKIIYGKNFKIVSNTKEIQDQGHRIGIICFLLVKNNFIKKEKCFKNFDT